MFSKQIQIAFETLTTEQQQAIQKLKELQKGKLFIGSSPSMMVLDFVGINVLKNTNHELANKHETALIAICNRNPSDTT